jgi:hypothetical protein
MMAPAAKLAKARPANSFGSIADEESCVSLMKRRVSAWLSAGLGGREISRSVFANEDR